MVWHVCWCQTKLSWLWRTFRLWLQLCPDSRTWVDPFSLASGQCWVKRLPRWLSSRAWAPTVSFCPWWPSAKVAQVVETRWCCSLADRPGLDCTIQELWETKNLFNPGSSPLSFSSSGILRTPWEKRVLRPKIGNERVSPVKRTVWIPGFDCPALEHRGCWDSRALFVSTSPFPTKKEKKEKAFVCVS